jgi:hypothetical protein
VKRVGRDEFGLGIKRTLANRVALRCANPECRAITSGPQRDPSNAINIGVAAHIRAASTGGPRFDPNMTDKERTNAANGIWLCQNCAKLIDNDEQAYPAGRLIAWKQAAEEYARNQLGKTKGKSETLTSRRMLAALKREQRLRDDMHREFLKSPAERMALPRFCGRSMKLAHSEIIFHRLGDTAYPKFEENEAGMSNWGKLEVLDFYHGGIHTILGIEYVLLDRRTSKWASLTYEQSKLSFPTRFTQGKIFMTGKIPWRNILHYDMRGDEYYPQPHLYVQYVNGEPYEGFAYFLLGNGYEQELSAEDRIELSDLLKLDAN